MRFFSVLLLLAALTACDNRATTAPEFLSGFNGVWQVSEAGSIVTLRWYYDPETQTVLGLESMPFQSVFFEMTPGALDAAERKIAGTLSVYSSGALVPAIRKQEMIVVSDTAPKPGDYRLAILHDNQALQQYTFVRKLSPDEILALHTAIDKKLRQAGAASTNTEARIVEVDPMAYPPPDAPHPLPPPAALRDSARRNMNSVLREFEDVYNNGGPAYVQDALTACYSDAGDKNSYERLVYCIVFDATASNMIRTLENQNDWPHDPEFDVLTEEKRMRESLIRMGYTDHDRQTILMLSIDKEASRAVESELPERAL